MKDTADGEFSVVKTAIARYLKMSDSASPDYVEIKDSASVVEFCIKHLSRPGSKAGLDERHFHDIKPDIFLQRKSQALETVKSLAGISTKFQYVCEVTAKCKVVHDLNNDFLVGWYCEMAKVSLLLP